MSHITSQGVLPDNTLVSTAGGALSSEIIDRPAWAKEGTLWIMTDNEVAPASLVVAVDGLFQRDPAKVNADWFVNAAPITADGEVWYHLGADIDRTAGGYTESLLILWPAFFRVRFVCSGASASFEVTALIEWHAN